MVAFFTAIGLGASLGLLKIGGRQVLIFWGVASLLAVLQNAIGVGLAELLGVNPLLGLITGSITMTGGHGTGAAFGKLMEDQYGFSAGVTLAMAAATFGLVSGGLIGGPVATSLIKRFNPVHRKHSVSKKAAAAAGEFQSLDQEIDVEAAGAPATAYTLLKILMVVLATMWAGGLLSRWLGQYVTLPAYIGAMIVAAVVRNSTDLVPSLKLEQRTIDDLGTVALSLFLSMALMSLRLWFAGQGVHPVHPAALAILLGIVAMSVVLAKSFCSHLCPVGALSEWLGRLGQRLLGGGDRLRLPPLPRVQIGQQQRELDLLRVSDDALTQQLHCARSSVLGHLEARELVRDGPQMRVGATCPPQQAPRTIAAGVLGDPGILQGRDGREDHHSGRRLARA